MCCVTPQPLWLHFVLCHTKNQKSSKKILFVSVKILEKFDDIELEHQLSYSKDKNAPDPEIRRYWLQTTKKLGVF